jgi:hypothetical protein
MKLPNLPKPSRSGAPKAAKATSKPARSPVQMPPFLADLMRDMRDRRLIVPAIALLVAIVAVPVALTASSEPVAPASQYVLPEEAQAVQPAVLAEEQVGVRDYRKRLAELRAKNPFKVPPAPKEAGDNSGSLTAPESSPVDSVAPEQSSTSVSSSSLSSDSVSSDSVSSDSSTPTDSTPVSTPPADNTPDTTQSPDSNGGGLVLFETRVDVKMGPIGHVKKFDDVKESDFLPERQTPVLVYLGARIDLSRAMFLVSPDVTATKGDGECGPSAKDCQVLRMREGDTRVIDYGGDGKKYRFKLIDIRKVVVEQHKTADG